MIDLPGLPELRVAREDSLGRTVPEGALGIVVGDGPPDHLSAVYRIDLAAVVAAQRVGPARTAHTIDLPPILGRDPWRDRPRRLVLAGAGRGTPADLRDAGFALARGARGLPQLTVDAGGPFDAEQSAALVEGLMLGSYRTAAGAPDAATHPCPAIELCGELVDTELDLVAAGVWGTFVARTLAATPSNVKSPAWLADACAALAAAQASPHLTCETRDERWLAESGCGAILAVGGGSVTPPRLVTLRYDAPGHTGAPVVLVGKGITYDTGGLSLKAREAMVPMKTDMSGAAVVLATVLGAARAGLATSVVAVLPLAENALGGAAWRPGDVVRTVDGTTVEIRNTDAEGRMVLADAIAWARAEYQPDVLVDVATLTGAATVALGRQHAALFASDDALAAELVDAGARRGEGLWRMPLVDDYRAALASDVADLAHIANNDHVKAGAVVAALFLRHFAGTTRWAHLDIAGTGRTGAKTPELSAHAPTGFGVRTLLGWLAS